MKLAIKLLAGTILFSMAGMASAQHHGHPSFGGHGGYGSRSYGHGSFSSGWYGHDYDYGYRRRSYDHGYYDYRYYDYGYPYGRRRNDYFDVQLGPVHFDLGRGRRSYGGYRRGNGRGC